MDKHSKDKLVADNLADLGEFDIIKKYFVKLTKATSSLNLQDDCAVLNPINDKKFIVNLDSIAENRHFFRDDGGKSIANKLLGANLSDIASMGAYPLYWTMSLGISDYFKNHTWLQSFSKELASIQNKYGFYLVGGDTIATEQLVLTCNMVGVIPKNSKPLLQSGAKLGDIICVSNNIGDSYWGLQLLLNPALNCFTKLYQNQKKQLIHSYHHINPQIELGMILLNLANSCTDVSDGLIADLEKIILRSSVSAEINLEDIPFSNATQLIHKQDTQNIFKSIAGGDDYQLVFSISKANLKKLRIILAERKLDDKIKITQIGKITEKNVANKRFNNANSNNLQSCANLKVLQNGQQVELISKGFSHS